MDIQRATVYSDIDANSLYVHLVDEAYETRPPKDLQSYLNVEKVFEAAERYGVDAIYLGYGFLSENPEFFEMAESRGITVISPSSECVLKAKPKNRAR
jgi:acetyl/propionyl-CoA carboxylase alpha subunit